MSDDQKLFPVDGVRVDISKSEQVHKYDVHVFCGDDNVSGVLLSGSNESRSHSCGSGSDLTSSASCCSGSLISDALPAESAINSFASVKSATTTTVDRRAVARSLINKVVQQYLRGPTSDCTPRELFVNLHFPLIDDVDTSLQPQQTSSGRLFSSH
uniref:Uncharacterized protein n=1 Tax=Plectus sambesii TaxID=2011161 RepID=A0A914VMJ2_9BILA